MLIGETGSKKISWRAGILTLLKSVIPDVLSSRCWWRILGSGQSHSYRFQTVHHITGQNRKLLRLRKYDLFCLS